MKTMLAGLAGLCFGVAATLGAQGTVTTEVDRAHDLMMQATRKQDTSAWAMLVTPDVLWVPGDGRLIDKAQRIEEIKAGQGLGAAYDGLTVIRARPDYNVRVYGDTAIVSWNNLPGLASSSTGLGGRVVRVFVKQNGAWRLAHQQQTPVR